MNSLRRIGLCVAAAITLLAVSSRAERVISGGQTNKTSMYQVAYYWKGGWWDNGWVYYNPNDTNSIEVEYEGTLTDANYYWGSNALALQTLNDRYGYSWCTADFDSVAQFDTNWPQIE